MPARKKPSTSKRPKAARKAAGGHKTVAGKATAKKATAKKATPGKLGAKKAAARKPAGRRQVPISRRPTAKATTKATTKTKSKTKTKKKPAGSALPRIKATSVKTVPLRRPLTGTPVPNRVRKRNGAGAEDRVTPLVNRAPVEAVPEVAGFRPSRILTTRPRPVIRQFDPSGGSSDAPRTLQPWEVEVDDLAELMAARAAEEKAAEESNARFVTTPASAFARIDEARAAGWEDDKRPSPAGLKDERVRLVHAHCKFIDGSVVRDVSLCVHPPSGRATLLLEGGARLRTASFRMREGEDLPSQIRRLIDDPARMARTEHASSRDLLAELEALDRAAVRDLRELAAGDRGALGTRLRAYVATFAATHSAYGLPATVDGCWERFGVRRDSVLERLGLAEDARRSVADAFDAALDQG